MSLRNSTKFCTKVRKVTKKKGTDSRTEERRKSFWPTQSRSKIYKKLNPRRHRPPQKKGKAKDSSGVRAEQLKNCSDTTKEKSGRSSMKSHD